MLQSSAKGNYMLTDGDLKKLGSISRNNPRKKDWSAMRLYLQSQVKMDTKSQRACISGMKHCSLIATNAKVMPSTLSAKAEVPVSRSYNSLS